MLDTYSIELAYWHAPARMYIYIRPYYDIHIFVAYVSVYIYRHMHICKNMSAMDAYLHTYRSDDHQSGKPTRSWAACFSDSAKQTNFWDMAKALGDELASFNIVVEKWDSSKNGGKRGGSKGKQRAAKGYRTRRQRRAHRI
jgi:hypothetical protein